MTSDATVGPGAPSRRHFLGRAALLGGSALAAYAVFPEALAIGPGRPDFHGRDSIFWRKDPLDDPSAITYSTCLGCHGACPVRISVEAGVVARLDGSAFSPRTFAGSIPETADAAAHLRGEICARGLARLQNLYDPHRLLRPLVKEGRRGGGRWRSLTADALGAALAEAITTGSTGRSGRVGGDVVVAVDPRQQDRAPVLRAFTAGVRGTAAHLGTPAPWIAEASAALLGTPGWSIEPRWGRARAVLCWGADPFASGVDPVGGTRGIARARTEHAAPLIVVDPRLSGIAGQADVWLPVRPGGDLALAWMLLRAWHQRGLLSGHEDDVAPAIERPLGDLERRAGVGYGLVQRAADRMVEAGSGLAIQVGGGVGEQDLGSAITEAILRFGVLAGATARGGAMEPVSAPPAVGRRPPRALTALLADQGRIDVLIVAGDGGILGSPQQAPLLAALADPDRVGLLIVAATAMNPVAALADFVVPDRTELERHGLVERSDGTSILHPAVPSLLTTSGLAAPWDHGLEGLLEVLSAPGSAPLDCEAVVERAIARTGAGDALRARGWVAPSASGTPPKATAFREGATRAVIEPARDLALITYREPFGGFHDSTAQYWATPSLRRGNTAWLHSATAAEIGIREGERVQLSVGHAEVLLPVRMKGEVRPGVVAVAVGYGHKPGYDGAMEIDGEAVQIDRRRMIGVDAAALRGVGELHARPGGREKGPSLWELLANGGERCGRL